MQRNSIIGQAFVRETNLSTVLRHLQSQTPLSRAQLAALIGLNKSTVSSLVEELIARGLVHEIGVDAAHAGRPAMLLEIDPDAGGIIGVEWGVDFVSVVLTNFTGQILWRQSQESDPLHGQDTTISQTMRLIEQAKSACRKIKLRILGLGMSTPGTVDLKDGMLIFAPNLHWRNIPLRNILSESTGLRVFVDNDANTAAVGEHLFGVARSVDNFIFVFAGVGIGAGLFLNGELYRGNNGFAGEVGHSPISSEALHSPCHCGNRGCWETSANQYSIIQRIQARLEVKRNTIIPKLMTETNAPLSISLVKQAADAGDAEALETFQEAGLAMGMGIASLVNIFNPEKIVIGGPLSIAGNYLLPAILEGVEKHSLPEIREKVDVLLSSFGPDASVMGAAALVVAHVLSKPVYVERR